VAVVVISSAIQTSNVELIAAREARLPIVPRAEMLSELIRLKWSVAIAGTHGKTTTTSLIGEILEAADFDPTVINGGIINAYGSNTRLGDGDWVVVEADESDGTFLKLRATCGVVTNIDPEHLDHYGNFAGLMEAFTTFVGNLPFYGCAAVCLDHPHVQSLIPKVSDRRLITYGFSPQADMRAVNIEAIPNGSRFDVQVAATNTTMKAIFLPMHGQHNIQNALAAMAIATFLGVKEDTIRQALAQFSGVKRRFTKVGEVGGTTLIDDYGHHPVEIEAVLNAARGVCKGKLIAVIQPHRYTRVRDLWEAFAKAGHVADKVYVAPIYSAGENPIDGITHDNLVASMREHGHRHAFALEGLDNLATVLAADMAEGNYIIGLGAGSITTAMNALPEQLQAGVTPTRKASA
jgi:UDP-N-acetylmuramate--alanine ligase